MIDVLELAKQAGFDEDPPDSHCRGTYFDCTIDELQTFANLVIEAHNKELLEGSGEPVLKVVHDEICYKDKSYSQSHGTWCPVTDVLDIFKKDETLYTADQLAAAVLRERERCLTKPRILYFDERVGIG